MTPPVSFGFGSTPEEPSLVRVLTRIKGADLPTAPDPAPPAH